MRIGSDKFCGVPFPKIGGVTADGEWLRVCGTEERSVFRPINPRAMGLPDSVTAKTLELNIPIPLNPDITLDVLVSVFMTPDRDERGGLFVGDAYVRDVRIERVRGAYKWVESKRTWVPIPPQCF